MNWKINYWTLLFALAAGGLAYQQYAGGAGKTPESKRVGNIITCSPNVHYDIPANVANQRMQLYQQTYAPKVQRFAADSCNTLNGGVTYFNIEDCELQAMLDSFQVYKTVNAFMSLIPGAGGAKDTLDIIFGVTDSTANSGFLKYYDFTKPCPPCPGL